MKVIKIVGMSACWISIIAVNVCGGDAQWMGIGMLCGWISAISIYPP